MTKENQIHETYGISGLMDNARSTISDGIRSITNPTLWRQSRCDSALKCPTNITLAVAIFLIQIIYHCLNNGTLSFGQNLDYILLSVLYMITLVLAFAFIVRMINSIFGSHMLESFPYVKREQYPYQHQQKQHQQINENSFDSFKGGARKKQTAKNSYGSTQKRKGSRDRKNKSREGQHSLKKYSDLLSSD